MTTQTIQLQALKMLSERAGRQVLRAEVAKAVCATGKAVDAAMARCALVRRVTANGGHHIRFEFAD